MFGPVSQGPPALHGLDAQLLPKEMSPHRGEGQPPAFSPPIPSLSDPPFISATAAAAWSWARCQGPVGGRIEKIVGESQVRTGTVT